MPLTTGPGTISVAFHGRRPPQRLSHLLARLLGRNPGGHGRAVGADLGFYRNSARLAQWIGVTGTTIVVRLSAFLLFWHRHSSRLEGVSELWALAVLTVT